jgi:hypothetical protein
LFCIHKKIYFLVTWRTERTLSVAEVEPKAAIIAFKANYKTNVDVGANQPVARALRVVKAITVKKIYTIHKYLAD